MQAGTLPQLVERMNAVNGDDVVDLVAVESAVAGYDAAIRRGERFFNDEQLRRVAWLRRWHGDRMRTCAFRPILDRRAGPLMAIREHIISRGGAVALTQNGRRKVIEAYERRMDTLISHPLFGYAVSYRRIMEIQARLLARHVLGELRSYPVFRTR